MHGTNSHPERGNVKDCWETDRWDGRSDSEYWPIGFDKPRTCSYCGGAHPEDAIKLMEQGWEVEATTKSYKRYMQPPGFAGWFAQMLEQIDPKQPMSKQLEGYGVKSPVPPVKLYIEHFTDEQIDRFNQLIRTRYKKADDGSGNPPA